ncbi:hypothetical protein QAD02_019594 [Eretmocerus hayati]|uniref:Uncharacterized protein n=1 Tax=Eretmocerus hayati TaxID=131215 RepID=A0ACC2PN68_9HYME|nr:hypothetical protein QAD02_019594 [Eretmocerus hayati]
MIVDFFTVGILTTFSVFIYLAFFWKINWIRDLTKQDTRSSKFRARKTRKIGDLPPVYPNGWFAVLESSNLKRGQVEHVSALGQNLAVFRTDSGVACILDAYCPHLGANLAEGGQVKGEDLECPFHCWRFCGKSGKCTSIPYLNKAAGSIKTRVWESCEANGVIFMWHHAEHSQPYWWPQQIEKIENGSWGYQGRNEFYINCHIQEIPENGADWAHLEALHGPSILATNLLSNLVHHSWTNVGWSTDYTESRRCTEIETYPNESEKSTPQDQSMKHIATSRLCHQVVLFNRLSILKLDVTATQIGPGYVELLLQTTFGPMCIIQTVTPLEPLLQRVTHLMFAPVFMAPYSRVTMLGECLMFERDAQVWNYKKYLDNPILIKEEKTIKEFRRWYEQFYSKNSPSYESCKDSLEW